MEKEQLKKIREHTGFNQGEFASKIGVSRGTIAKAESYSNYGISKSLIEKITKAFGDKILEIGCENNTEGGLYGGNILRYIRKRKGVNKKEFSVETGISISSINACEKYGKPLSKELFDKILERWPDIVIQESLKERRVVNEVDELKLFDMWAKLSIYQKLEFLKKIIK